MNHVTDRLRQIEEGLIEEFQAEGHQVINEGGSFVALVETLKVPGMTEWTKIDLTRTAQTIERRLSP